MMDRRNMLLGAACVGSLGVAEWLRPRRQLKLLQPKRELTDIVATKFGNWHIADGGDIVVPQTPGSLSSRLYSATLTRLYRREVPHLDDVMLLIAYGEAQSDLLQLHRPESCYPAVGFQITHRRLTFLPLANGVTIPVVMLTADGGSRIEDVIYWTRLGEALPQTAGDQRRDRLMAAMQGYVGDGALIRASSVRTDRAVPNFDVIADFLPNMVHAIAPADRKALIGTKRAQALAGIPSA